MKVALQGPDIVCDMEPDEDDKEETGQGVQSHDLNRKRAYEGDDSSDREDKKSEGG